MNMKKTSMILVVAITLVASRTFPQTDEKGRGQARGGHPQSGQTQHPQPRPPASPPAHAQQRPPDHPRGTTGVVPPAHPHPPLAGPRYRVYPEPRAYPYMHPHVGVPVVVYPQPHFWFRPWMWLGFGIYIGYPVPYPVFYGIPTYAYGEGNVYPTPITYGGIAFSIVPDDADVIVDGSYVGAVRDFSPTRQPLTLLPGRHHVEIEVAGMTPLAFDVDIVAGQVIPYSGRLQPE